MEQVTLVFPVNSTLPKHEASLTLEHNDHKSVYQTVAQYIQDNSIKDEEWLSIESKERAISTNELWVMQWYPHTAIGFYRVAAPTLAELFECANQEN